MVRLEMKIYQAILKKKQKKYKHYHQVNLINMNIYRLRSITL